MWLDIHQNTLCKYGSRLFHVVITMGLQRVTCTGRLLENREADSSRQESLVLKTPQSLMNKRCIPQGSCDSTQKFWVQPFFAWRKYSKILFFAKGLCTYSQESIIYKNYLRLLREDLHYTSTRGLIAKTKAERSYKLGGKQGSIEIIGNPILHFFCTALLEAIWATIWRGSRRFTASFFKFCFQ